MASRKYPAGTSGGRGGQFAPGPGTQPPTAAAATPAPPVAGIEPDTTQTETVYQRFQHLTEPELDDDERYDDLFLCQEHDYDPRWDYTIRYDQLDHPLTRHAQTRANYLATLDDTPFNTAHIYPAELDDNVVAVYCSGTYNEPVILINVDAHTDPDVISPEDEIRRTVDHEVTHAAQEADWDGDPDNHWADEDHAEHQQYPLSDDWKDFQNG